MLWAASVIFVGFEAVMFCLIHFVRADSNYDLHYASVVGAAVFAWVTLVIELITAWLERKPIKDIASSPSEGNLIRVAMLFTLLADYFLVALDRPKHLEGVIVFLGTQLFICLHIISNEKNKKMIMVQLIIRYAVTLVLICVVGIVLGKDTDPLSIVSTVYYANLCINAVFAHRSGRGGIMLTVGLVLFALCDINVGLSALNDIYDGGFPEGSLLYALLNTELDLIWIFYIPSQTLIPLSLLATDKKTDVQ